MKLQNKTGKEFKGEVSSGRFPPYIHYKLLYTSPQEKRLQPSLMMVDLKGSNENVKLSFDIMEEACKYVHDMCMHAMLCLRCVHFSMHICHL